jgi:hypothetical protein
MNVALSEPAVISTAYGAGHGMAQFREFLRGLAMELDAQAGPQGRDILLRSIGLQMARLIPILPVASMEALEMEINERLATIGWGHTRLVLQEADRCLIFTHSGLPRIGSVGEPHGFWLSAVLEGLYEGWMAQQPGADPALAARRQMDHEGDAVILRYGHIQ